MQIYRNLGPIAWVAITLVVLDAINVPIVLLLRDFAPDFFITNITPIASSVDGASIIITITTMVVFGYWIYAAGRNVSDSEVEGLKFTPAARIWWFAVPLANLVMPFQGMRELWNASHGEPNLEKNHGLIASWWAFWLINNVTANIVNFAMRDAQTGMTPFWLVAATGVPLAVTAILILRSITAAQRKARPQELSEVFA